MRWKLKIAYDGRPYCGWQSQAGGGSVQDALEAALSKLSGGGRVAVHGSGRTDAGVHALGQVAHADLPERDWSGEKWRAAINAHLPGTIRVLQMAKASPSFHARFDAVEKSYRYRIWNGPVLPPLEIGRAWHIPEKLDLDLLKRGSRKLCGRHDFFGFSARRVKGEEDTVRTLESILVKKRGRLVTLEFAGDGFLYKMARLLTGSLVRVAQGKESPEWLAGFLANRRRSTYAAPAEGLYLQSVRY